LITCLSNKIRDFADCVKPVISIHAAVNKKIIEFSWQPAMRAKRFRLYRFLQPRYRRELSATKTHAEARFHATDNRGRPAGLCFQPACPEMFEKLKSRQAQARREYREKGNEAKIKFP
jgi:hypothetical protein